MASRRTRIKGIANIPQRRKNNVTNEEPIEPQIKIESENDNLTFDSSKTVKEEAQPKLCPNIVKKHELESCISEFNPNSKDCNGDISENVAVLTTSFNTNSNTITDCDINNEVSNENAIKVENDKNSDHEPENKEIVPQPIQPPKPLLLRRKFTRPIISANVINRKPKQEADKECIIKTEVLEAENNEGIPKEKFAVEKIVILNKVIIPPRNVADSTTKKEVKYADLKSEQPQLSVTNLRGVNEVTLDETYLTPQNELMPKPEVLLDKNVRKLTPHTNYAHNSDSEYPPPPQSPSKINRSRIKAIPRLSHRKTSFSASESEDESRKNYNRNRNDSVCSTASGVPDSITECMSPQRPKEVNAAVQQKKCNRTEQSRKLAEARREFQRRFGANKPDRQKLTMIDLIFYNPTSNPMTNETKPNQEKIEEVKETVLDGEANEESEKVDDPKEDVANEDVDKSDEENEMPVPQIKIGPSGEIILDEKSLVIESKEVKKQREQLQKTQIVDGDFDTGYGVYKRQKRAKDWSHSETLRFYKALNTIGTDFYLMCELFPRRTRRELKMKFKKEERINRTLVDRAVMQPCRFDFAELKHEVEMEEKELEELQKQKEVKDKLRLEKHEVKLSRKRKALTKYSIEEDKKPVKALKPKPPKIRKVRKPRMKKLCIENILENSDADESDIATQSESDDEISMPLKPTRSGRIPKISEKFDSTKAMSVENIMRRNKVGENSTKNNIEPGSIMIITEKGPNGEPVYKIFMVTPDQNATPLNLTSEVVSKAIEFKKGVTAQNIMTISANVTDDEDNTVQEENNVTIPADENVTTLKGNNYLSHNMKHEECQDVIMEYNYTIPANENVTIPADEHVTIPANENITIPADENVGIPDNKNFTNTTPIKEEYLSETDAKFTKNMGTD